MSFSFTRGAFGGMGSQTAFGPRGSATILSKATTIAAGLFMVKGKSEQIQVYKLLAAEPQPVGIML